MKLIKDTAIISTCLMLSRGLGYAREIILASKYGVSSQSDLIVLGLSVPELLSSLAALGICNNILLPLMSGKTCEEISEVSHEAYRKLFFLAVITYAVAQTIFFIAFDLKTLYVMSLANLSLLFAPSLAVMVAYLGFRRDFLVQSLSGVVFNLMAICALWFGTEVYSVVFGFLIASLLRLLFVRNDAVKKGFPSEALSLRRAHSGNDISIPTLMYALLASGATIATPLMMRFFASGLTVGSVSILSYAEKLYLLPMSVVLTPYAVASYPLLVEEMRGGNKIRHKELFSKILPVMGIAIIFATTFVFFSNEIVRLTFGLAGIEVKNQEKIAEALVPFSVLMILASASTITTNILFAMKNIYSTTVSTLCFLCINLIVGILVNAFNGSFIHLAWGTVLSNVILVIHQWWLITRKVQNAIDDH